MILVTGVVLFVDAERSLGATPAGAAGEPDFTARRREVVERAGWRTSPQPTALVNVVGSGA